MAKSNMLAIIAEYNPFHFGHLYQLEECKKKSKADFVVIIMSGNFTQRGEPAILDKQSRANMALKAGADLVIELPFYYACNSAEYFATGAIDIIEALGVVTHLGFGCESGETDKLDKIAEILTDKSEKLTEEIKKNMASGCQYSKALQLAFEKIDERAFDIDSKILTKPNNVLAIEYLKAIKKKGLDIVPIGIKRAGTAHNGTELSDGALDTESEIKTDDCKDMLASGILAREKLKEIYSISEKSKVTATDFLPKDTKEILERKSDKLVFCDNEIYFNILRSAILSRSEGELREVFSIGEGLENKLKSELRYANNLDELIKRVKSKRYPYTRINRICTQIVVGLAKSEPAPRYVRVLGFNKNGSELLKKIKNEGEPKYDIITNINRASDTAKRMLQTDIRATDIYNLLAKNDLYKSSDYVQRPIIVQ